MHLVPKSPAVVQWRGGITVSLCWRLPVVAGRLPRSSVSVRQVSCTDRDRWRHWVTGPVTATDAPPGVINSIDM